MDFANDKAGPRFAPVILAGGSGTRFWPRSRRAHAKQVLALDGERTMIQQTLERLLPVAAAEDVWVITNRLLAAVIAEQLPGYREARFWLSRWRAIRCRHARWRRFCWSRPSRRR